MTTGQKELPAGWKWVKLGEVCDVRDGTHDTPKYVSDGIPLITSKNLKPYGLDFDNTQDISYEDFLQISKRSGVDVGDVLYGMIGTIGNPVLVNTDRQFAIKNLALFKLQESPIDPSFFVYAMQSSPVADQIIAGTKGGIQTFVSLKILRTLNFPLPPLEEQKRIVGILNKAEEIKKLRDEADKKTEELIPAIFHEMVGSRNKRGEELPSGWKLVKLGDVCTATQGVQIPKSSQMTSLAEGFKRYFYISDFEHDSNLKYVKDKYPNKVITTDDLVVANTGAYGRVFRGMDGVLSNNLFKVGFKPEEIDEEFLFNFIDSQEFKDFQDARAKGSTNPHMGHKNFLSTPFLLPPLSEQKRIAERLKAADEIKKTNSESHNKIEELKSSLLQRAFRGEL